MDRRSLAVGEEAKHRVLYDVCGDVQEGMLFPLGGGARQGRVVDVCTGCAALAEHGVGEVEAVGVPEEGVRGRGEGGAVGWDEVLELGGGGIVDGFRGCVVGGERAELEGMDVGGVADEGAEEVENDAVEVDAG
jgi:hypothetical protein